MDNLNIDSAEVLRYLGYRQQSLEPDFYNLLSEAIEETKTLIQPRVVHRFFKLRREADQLFLADASLSLPGQGIAKHLETASSCVLLAITLGLAIERKISYYEKVDLTRAMFIDASASTAVEEFANKVCGDLARQLATEYQLTSRFSPGYADFPLEIQGQLLTLLNAEREIGLQVSAHSILSPRKSITALVGLVKSGQQQKQGDCLDCSHFSDCQFRKDRKANGC